MSMQVHETKNDGGMELAVNYIIDNEAVYAIRCAMSSIRSCTELMAYYAKQGNMKKVEECRYKINGWYLAIISHSISEDK